MVHVITRGLFGLNKVADGGQCLSKNMLTDSVNMCSLLSSSNQFAVIRVRHDCIIGYGVKH